ncbi:PKD domain-containing protein [Chryseobacterium sp.]|uniref:PKD domain-containing protein n=1 Tax=Chryseobacterium sp. TaxID=1871047 RepID=UPI0032194C95
MNKKLLTLCKVGLFSVVTFSCSGSSDDITESMNVNVGANSLALISSKTHGSIHTPIQFSFKGGTKEDINNINWDFGDGSTYHGDGSLEAVYHDYNTAGNYTVKATLLLADGKSVEKTVKVTITNTNILKINKITIISIPKKENNLRLVYNNGVSYWENFKGAWDESKSYNTTDPDRLADIFLEISKVFTAVDKTNPHNLLVSRLDHLLTTDVRINQTNLEFDLTGKNIFMGYETLQSLSILLKDSDANNSLLENGEQNEFIGLFSIPLSDFTGTSRTVSNGSSSIKIDFEKL